MLTVKVICVGKLKERFYIAAAEEYAKRLSSLCRLEVEEINEQRLPDSPSPAEIDSALFKEASAILKAVPAGANLVSLCIEGSRLSSEELSAYINKCSVNGLSRLCFVIGGSFGLHESVKRASALRLSMSDMTFPHHLARIMLLEQLYRSFKITEGSKYHK